MQLGTKLLCAKVGEVLVKQEVGQKWAVVNDVVVAVKVGFQNLRY